jgi:serine/threonine protein kinase
MGVVYRAYDPRLKRQVAIKVIRSGGFARKEERARFHTEAEAIARLQHPDIAHVYEVGEHRDGPYLVLEYVEGGSLDHHLAEKPQPARAAACLVERLARAIQHAHERGIVHRDLKPANVLLTGVGTPKASDFGLAKRLEGGAGVTSSGAPLGTASYMPPEQVRAAADQVGPAADVYALGAILYEMLTGRPPFQGASAAETMLRVLAEGPAPPRRSHPRVPRDLETICLKCLEKQPGRRYASAQALADDLARFPAGKPIEARPIGARERGMKWARRRPVVAAPGRLDRGRHALRLRDGHLAVARGRPGARARGSGATGGGKGPGAGRGGPGRGGGAAAALPTAGPTRCLPVVGQQVAELPSWRRRQAP